MFSYSIIIPSFNQEKFIKETLENVCILKNTAAQRDIRVQILVVDNCSDAVTKTIIESFEKYIDILIIEKDKGQYDAINKGLKLVNGDYWTWLNTDDLLDTDGFFKTVSALEQTKYVDYIYGNVAYMSEDSSFQKDSSSGELSLNKLVHQDASISQPGSFFRTDFTKKIGELAPYHFAFDYEYILRCLKNKASLFKLNTNVAFFRYYSNSKSGSQDFRFLKEQLDINRLYGGKLFSKLNFMLRLRILKRKLFN